VSQYLSALRPFPPYMANAPYLGLSSHLGLPAFPGMPAHPVGPLNGKLSPSDHDKVRIIIKGVDKVRMIIIRVCSLCKILVYRLCRYKSNYKVCITIVHDAFVS
jgi:hypothetical protein